MYCTNCGSEMPGTARFCAECGKAAGTQTASNAGHQPRARLARDMANKKIAGVCAGFARHMDWDVTLVRIAFLAGIVIHGVGLLAYLIAWVAMPRDDIRGFDEARPVS